MEAETDLVAGLRARISTIETLIETTFGVQDADPLLEELLEFLLAHPEAERAFKSVFVDLADDPGSVEIVEFCMHSLRWPEVREAVIERRDAISRGQMGRA